MPKRQAPAVNTQGTVAKEAQNPRIVGAIPLRPDAKRATAHLCVHLRNDQLLKIARKITAASERATTQIETLIKPLKVFSCSLMSIVPCLCAMFFSQTSRHSRIHGVRHFVTASWRHMPKKMNQSNGVPRTDNGVRQNRLVSAETCTTIPCFRVRRPNGNLYGSVLPRCFLSGQHAEIHLTGLHVVQAEFSPRSYPPRKR